MKQPIYGKESLANLLANDPKVAEQAQAYLGSSKRSFTDFQISSAKTENVFRGIAPGALTREEAIIQLIGRPALLIKNGKWDKPVIPELVTRLDKIKPQLEKAILSVAKVEIGNLPDIPYYGTAWVIDERLIVTNRHVAQHFTWRDRKSIRFKTTVKGEAYKPRVDFLEEYENPDSFEVGIQEIVYVEQEGDQFPDIAFFRLEEHGNLPDPIEFDDKEPEFRQEVVAIGYPMRDPRNDLFDMEKLFKSVYEVKRLSPGMVMGTNDPSGMRFYHDCTTLGGSSGSVILSLDSGKAVGLHYWGDYKKYNLAVRINTVKESLRRLGKVGVVRTTAIIGSPEGVEAPALVAADLADRKGFNTNFLKASVPLPVPSKKLAKKVTKIPGTDDDLLHYTHFSIKMHEDRKLAMFTAVNIDGKTLVRYDRGNDRWYPDPRLDDEYQTLDELYAYSKFEGRRRLQRGHLVRRLDPMWGRTEEEILQAQEDTFFFTNCTPQHENFNPKIWLDLENYVLDAADDDDFKVSVFTGPIFSANDPVYHDFLIPIEYWKVVSVYVPSRKRLSSTAYILNQDRWIRRMEDPYGDHPDQVSIAYIEEKTGLDFGVLKDYDPLGHIESIVPHTITTSTDIVL